jgi:Cys-rich four helix bundle protein (predicted Tat secretion target)
MLAAAATGQVFAAEHEHEHHHPAMAANQVLINATSDCIQKGQACLNHCFTLLGQGEKEMAACAASVNQMLAMCAALQQLASANSKYLAAQAKVVMEVCKDCQEECKKHASKHEECKLCGEACAVCYKECQKVAA